MLKASGLTTGSTLWRQRRGRTVRTELADHLDRKGDRIEAQLDRRGDRIEDRYDHVGDRADRWYDNRGDRINSRFDNRGFFNRWWWGRN